MGGNVREFGSTFFARTPGQDEVYVEVSTFTEDHTRRASLQALNVASPALEADPETVCPADGAIVLVTTTS